MELSYCAQMPTMSTNRDAVMAVLRKVGRIRGIDPDHIQADRGLVDLGYQSLDLAQIVALLEQRLGVDPFERQAITDVRTVEDLCAAYARTLADEQPASDPTPES